MSLLGLGLNFVSSIDFTKLTLGPGLRGNTPAPTFKPRPSKLKGGPLEILGVQYGASEGRQVASYNEGTTHNPIPLIDCEGSMRLLLHCN